MAKFNVSLSIVEIDNGVLVSVQDYANYDFGGNKQVYYETLVDFYDDFEDLLIPVVTAAVEADDDDQLIATKSGCGC